MADTVKLCVRTQTNKTDLCAPALLGLPLAVCSRPTAPQHWAPKKNRKPHFPSSSQAEPHRPYLVLMSVQFVPPQIPKWNTEQKKNPLQTRSWDSGGCPRFVQLLCPFKGPFCVWFIDLTIKQLLIKNLINSMKFVAIYRQQCSSRKEQINSRYCDGQNIHVVFKQTFLNIRWNLNHNKSN